MAEDIILADLILKATNKYVAASIDDVARNYETLNRMFPHDGPPAPTAPYVPPPYQPSERAEEMLAGLRKLLRQKATRKKLLQFLDGHIGEIEEAVAERYDDY